MALRRISLREALLFVLFLCVAAANFGMYSKSVDKVILDLATNIVDSVHLTESTLGQRRTTYGDEATQPTAPTIRNWGCDRTEAPLVFVHVGKSGGGTVRARLAASALNFTRPSKAWKDDWKDNSYYPVGPNERGFYCNNGHPHYRVQTGQPSEKAFFCHATTPLGQAIACPEPLNWTNGDCKRCDPSSEKCPVVYTGHNFLGSELHWLPQRYLSKWWENSWVTDEIDSTLHEDKIESLLQTLEPGNTQWCPLDGKRPLSRPQNRDGYIEHYAQCSSRLLQLADKEAFHAVQRRPSFMASQPAQIQHPHDIDWSALYASLPVLRVTVVRDPYSWFMSKFFWHNIGGRHMKCDDLGNATMVRGPFDNAVPAGRAKNWGWLHKMAMSYIVYLCGEDCLARHYLEVSSLEQLERQAANNLRNSFAVVGMLNETDKFLDMITARVQYVNLTLNPGVRGPKHPSGGSAESKRCKAVFQDPSFQAQLRERSPAVAALDRLYHIAIEVNRHQLNELRQCADPSLEL